MLFFAYALSDGSCGCHMRDSIFLWSVHIWTKVGHKWNFWVLWVHFRMFWTWVGQMWNFRGEICNLLNCLQSKAREYWPSPCLSAYVCMHKIMIQIKLKYTYVSSWCKKFTPDSGKVVIQHNRGIWMLFLACKWPSFNF